MSKCLYDFDWVYLYVADGHYEHNALKAYFKINWKPVFSRLARELGFMSHKRPLLKHVRITISPGNFLWCIILPVYCYTGDMYLTKMGTKNKNKEIILRMCPDNNLRQKIDIQIHLSYMTCQKYGNMVKI